MNHESVRLDIFNTQLWIEGFKVWHECVKLEMGIEFKVLQESGEVLIAIAPFIRVQ